MKKASAWSAFLAGMFVTRIGKLSRSRKKECNFTVAVPQSLYSSIWEENMKFMHEKRMYDVEYFEFMWKFLELNNNEIYQGIFVLNEDIYVS